MEETALRLVRKLAASLSDPAASLQAAKSLLNDSNRLAQLFKKLKRPRQRADLQR